jgi:hypothetical protein
LRTAKETFVAHRPIPESETALPELMIGAFLYLACIIRSGLWPESMQPENRFVETNSGRQSLPPPATAATPAGAGPPHGVAVAA